MVERESASEAAPLRRAAAVRQPAGTSLSGEKVHTEPVNRMKQPIFNLGTLSMAVVVGCLGFTAWIAFAVFHQDMHSVYAEQGPLENLQAFVLAIASFVYIALSTRHKPSDRLVLMFCGVMCAGLLSRELDIESFDVPAALIFIGSGAGRTATLVLAVAALLLMAWRDFHRFRQSAVSFVRSKPFQLLMAAGIMLFFGDCFEKQTQVFHHVMLEEVSELFGYGLILLSSIAAYSHGEVESGASANAK